MDHETIYAWTAKRAGGRITVYGQTVEGNARKIVGVDFVTVKDGRVTAVDKNENRYWLAL